MEDIPAAANTYDIVTQTNCFHELPTHAVSNTLASVSRVLKPGGLFLHMDSIQMEDDPSIASTVEVLFSGQFHEPFMLNFVAGNVNLDELCAEVGMVPDAPPVSFLTSTLRCYRKV